MALTERFAAKRGYVVTGLGVGQILSWGSTFYLLAVLAGPIIGSVLIDNLGHRNTLLILGLFAVLAFVLTLWLMLLHLGRQRTAEPAAEPAESSLSARPS